MTMCGIAGLFDIKSWRPFDAALLTRMTNVIAHRGPDGSGLHLEPGVALGHRRLAIIDLAGGEQPMRSADGALTVSFNGEIYNFRELRAELQAGGAGFVTRSDTEVLLHGWRAWGEGLFRRLQGMFAFALWDAREQTLVLARDRFGKKPLHYAALPDGVLAFASEIKSLLCLAELDRTLEPAAVADFFTYGYVPDPKTIYRAVRKLEPAHYLIARKGRPIETRRYWSVLETVGRSEPDSHDELVERLGRAVERRLVADVPLGALLSGGVDSSAVVALMAQRTSEPVRTFSIGFDEREVDESSYARAVADRYRTDHEARRVSADDFSLVHRLADIYDEPFGDVSAIPTFAACALAADFVKVALTGDGGDEVLGGYRRYRFHLTAERVRGRLAPQVRSRLFGALAGVYPRASWLPRWLRAKTTLRELSLDSASAYARICSALPEEARAPLLTPEFRGAIAGYRPEDIVRTAYNVDAELDPLQRAQYADLTTYLPGDILTKIDRASMANSLELRAPLLDAEFSAWSFRLPSSHKLSRGAGGKAILKRAMEPHLPAALLYRPKQGFTVPLARWFRGPLREDLLRLADSPRLKQTGVIDTATVRRLALGHASGAQDNSKALWLVWVFNAFLGHEAERAQMMTCSARAMSPQPIAASTAQIRRHAAHGSG
jgi:asparagine synthase (glutamine-hydrolysing)